MLRFVEASGIPVLVGSPGYRMQSSLGTGNGYELFNRAFLKGKGLPAPDWL